MYQNVRITRVFRNDIVLSSGRVIPHVSCVPQAHGMFYAENTAHMPSKTLVCRIYKEHEVRENPVRVIDIPMVLY